MPTENGSSNTELQKIEAAGAAMTQIRTMLGREQRPEQVALALEACDWSDTPIGNKAIILSAIRSLRAPQPHPEPIAWTVGTAFWWTKEEAERDAAETGLPIVGLGPMACATPADQHQGEPAKVRVGSGQFNDDDRYLLCREELRECEDERSALSDEARGLRDRAAKLDALLAEALLAIEGGCHAVSLPERISAALSCDDEQDPPSGYFFDTGPYQVELGEQQWLKALSVFDNYTQGNQDTFACPGDNLRGLVSEILIELGLAPAVD